MIDEIFKAMGVEAKNDNTFGDGIDDEVDDEIGEDMGDMGDMGNMMDGDDEYF
jgi:hypothetical protein